MASRLLHRLRHALAGEGPEEEAPGPEAEQFPESSELEDDDAEGLSSRLSGTLSFTSAEDEDEDSEESGPSTLTPWDGASGEDAGECRRARREPWGPHRAGTTSAFPKRIRQSKLIQLKVGHLNTAPPPLTHTRALSLLSCVTLRVTALH